MVLDGLAFHIPTSTRVPLQNHRAWHVCWWFHTWPCTSLHYATHYRHSSGWQGTLRITLLASSQVSQLQISNTLGTNILCSRQIRPPIYSMKQSKLRKRRVWRYAMLYFLLLVIFLALLVGPIFIGKSNLDLSQKLSTPISNWIQPSGLNNNDTLNRTETGTGCKTCSGAASTSGSSATGGAGARVRLF